MKKYPILMAALIVVCLAVGMMVCVADSALAKKQNVKFVVFGAEEGCQEIAAEAMAINMLYGALDYRMRTFHALKGKYNLKYVNTLFANADECLTGVASGAAEMTFSGPHYLEALEPAFKLVELPGVFEDWNHFTKTMNTPVWKAVHEKLAMKKDVTVLKWIANIGDWYLYTNKGPVYSVEDIKGQKIRFPGGEGFSKALKGMKTIPISLPYSEVISAFQTNMIDGVLTDFSGAFYFYDLPTYTKYCIKVAWAIQPICVVVNTQWWMSLPDAERQAMQDVFDRIDVSIFFENTVGLLIDGWAANPKTELIHLEGTELKRWKDAMYFGASDVLKAADPKLVEAIELSR